MRIKTIGMIIGGTLVLVSIAIINLAYINLSSGVAADKLWENTYTKASQLNNALQFLHQELGDEDKLGKLKSGELITDPEHIESLSLGVINARHQLLTTVGSHTSQQGSQHYIFISKLLDQYSVLIQASTVALDPSQPVNNTTLGTDFNNEDAYKALIYFDQTLQNTLLGFSGDANKSLLSLSKDASQETIAAALIILLASFASIWVLHTRVMTPLSRLQDVMSTIAVGDYSVDVPDIAKKDEIGEMARSLEILRDDAAELENVKEEQLINERRIAEDDKKTAEKESQRLIEEEKNKRQTEELRSRELTEEVARQTLELRKSEASLRGILDSALDAFISSNEQGVILSFNKSAEEMFGYSAEEAIGLHVHILVPDEFRNEHIEMFSNSVNASSPPKPSTERQIAGQHKDGRNFPVSVGLTSLNHDGELIYVAALRDRSGEVQKEQKLQRLGRLLDRSMREVYVLEADDFSFQEVNSRAVEVLGYKTEAFDKLKYTDILCQPAKEELAKLLAPLLKGEEEEVVFEGTHTCEDGSQYPVEVNVHYWTNEEPPVFLAVAQDMTTRLKVRQELLNSRDAAESASKAKSFFLANMSHELRTPLNAVLGYSEMLKEIAEENNHMDYANDLDKISIAAEHLLTLINDILDLSKITSGKADIVRHKTDVLGLVHEAGTLISPLVKAGKNELIIEAPDNMEPMYSDEVRIRQILINVLSNASKFTKNGTITLAVETCKREHKDHIKFIITDTGIGIPEDKIESIFDEFSQVNTNRETKSEGSGLGLSICRRLSHAMHGEISLTSELGVGTTVTIVLPNDIGEQDQYDSDIESNGGEQNENARASQIGTVPQQRIVVIESDVEEAQLIKAYLEVEDFEVEIAHSALDGISLIKSFNPDTVLLDMSLPNLIGSDAMKKINSEQSKNGFRIIICSEDNSDLQDSVIDTDNYILKPINKEALIKMVKVRSLMVSGAVS